MSGSTPCARSPSRMRSAVSKSLARFARTQSSRISSISLVLGTSAAGGAVAGSRGAPAPSGGPVGRLHDVCLVSAWYQYVVLLYRGSLASIQPGGSGGGSSSRGRFSPAIGSAAVAVSSTAGSSSAAGVSAPASGEGAATGSASSAADSADSAAAGGGSSAMERRTLREEAARTHSPGEKKIPNHAQDTETDFFLSLEIGTRLSQAGMVVSSSE